MAVDTIPKTGETRTREVRAAELLLDLAVIVAELSARVARLEEKTCPGGR